jgi:hypothetical protein
MIQEVNFQKKKKKPMHFKILKGGPNELLYIYPNFFNVFNHFSFFNFFSIFNYVYLRMSNFRVC